jgi:hypothetical protein
MRSGETSGRELGDSLTEASSHNNEQSREQGYQSARALRSAIRAGPAAILEYAAVWQVWLTLRLMAAAKFPVRDRRDRAE